VESKSDRCGRKYYERAGALNFYTAYRVHNYHFVAYGAMFLGQYAPAIAAANERRGETVESPPPSSASAWTLPLPAPTWT
jgi:hypothetical protein